MLPGFHGALGSGCTPRKPCSLGGFRSVIASIYGDRILKVILTTSLNPGTVNDRANPSAEASVPVSLGMQPNQAILSFSEWNAILQSGILFFLSIMHFAWLSVPGLVQGVGEGGLWLPAELASLGKTRRNLSFLQEWGTVVLIFHLLWATANPSNCKSGEDVTSPNNLEKRII